MQPTPLCPAHLLVADVSIWATSLLAVAVRCIFSVSFFFFLLLPGYVALWDSKTPKTCPWESFLLCGNFSSFMSPLPGQVSVPNSFVYLFVFYILSYLLSKRNGLPFWVPGVLHQRSEVVLWKLLSIQMIFWWICGRQSGLPILFLCHLGTQPPKLLLIKHTSFAWSKLWFGHFT